MMWKFLVAILAFLALFWFWPNFVHEPLHALTAYALGGSADMAFDLTHWPAHPVTTFRGVSETGGIIIALMPSIVVVLVLLWLWQTVDHPGMLTHSVLTCYVAIELTVNLLKHDAPFSDFRMLHGMPVLAFCAAAAVMLFAGYIIKRELDYEGGEAKTI